MVSSESLMVSVVLILF